MSAQRTGTRACAEFAPPGGPGRGGAEVLIGVGLAAAGPDEVEAFAILVLDGVRVDRSVEARAVQLDREIVTLLRGALRPSGADLGEADEDPMAQRIPAGAAGSRVMRTFFV